VSDRTHVEVTITVTVGDDTAHYDADTTTSTDGWDVAMSMVHGLKQAALEGTARRRGVAAAERGEASRPASVTAHLAAVTTNAAAGARRVAGAPGRHSQVGG
jgi:hypothetical protein